MLKACYPFPSADGCSGWRIAFTYDADLVERLKAAVPHFDREWHPDVLQWWVAAEYEAILRQLFKDFALFADAPRLL